ncbi:alkaline phosphatase [Janthinobacterium sp. 17J80-10]|nr:alkaline phosphatase [Janthinobacterium sp. 17J80-10]
MPAGFDPVTTKFEAKLGDKFDALLEKLAANGIPLAEIIAQSKEKTPASLTLAALSGFGGDVDGTGKLIDTHEIPAYDPASKRLFVVNGSGVGSVEVWNIADPKTPVQVGTLTAADFGTGLAGFNSVAVHNGVVALAIEASPKTSAGLVAFVRASNLSIISKIAVGAQPDMVTFSPDGRYVLSANEGEPNSYNALDSVDPEGSVSIIDVSDVTKPVERRATFTAFNGQEATLRAAGVRIYGPNATVAQDLEPEYVTVSADSKTAYVTLQENNAIAVVDIATAKVTKIIPLGFKDFNVAGYGIDASDEDGGTNTNTGTAAVKIATVPVKGMYLPDGIANYTVGGVTYLVTANEGDARADWPGFNEETRVREHCAAGGMDLSVFGASAANFLFDSNLGRLRITNTPNGGSTGKNASGECSELYAFGGRSFTIWNAATGARVFDSGDAFETLTSSLAGTSGFDFKFNTSHDNNSLDSRSPTKGPEPESVVLQRFGAKVFAFIGLERVGGVMVYDVTVPTAPKQVTYVNTRTGITGDRGPEGLIVIPAAKSPNGVPLLVVANEVSGTTRLFEIKLTY